ncbi:hypothetical protein D8B45_04845 [Candidatus Gracilibacteria bacterium]|nr:MAG: hypothetical protein D8B45_04845 [Candidatus Gracilibacteria bacterium]
MITRLDDAKNYAIEQVKKFAEEGLFPDEELIIETGVQEKFFEKIEGLVSEEEFAQAQAKNSEELESYLFHRIPNYVTLLQEATAEFLAEYLS